MVFPLLFGGLFGFLLRWFFNIWDTLDDRTKKIIIEAVIKAFETLLRNFYKQWKQRENKS